MSEENIPGVPGEFVEHEISQEDLTLNPELAEEGIKVGDVVELPMSDTPLTDEQKAEIVQQFPDLEGKLDTPKTDTE